LGFFSTENSTKHYVVIFYTDNTFYVNNIRYEDVVWVADREHLFPNLSAALTFELDGNLAISDGRSLYLLTNTSGGNNTFCQANRYR
jgi:hypothetical protein